MLPNNMTKLEDKIIAEDDGIFVEFRKEAYLFKLAEKIKKLKIRNASQITPQVLEQSPYKLHVSLQNDHNTYDKLKNEIKDIIVSYLKKEVINDFKLISDKFLKNLDFFKTFKNLASQLNDIKKTTSEEECSELEKKFLAALENYKKLDPRFNETDVSKVLVSINKVIGDAERLLSGDQFTIYIPENFNKEEIFNLCKEINDYLENNAAMPGARLDIESPIGRYINFRQEYLKNDWEEINQKGVIDLRKRINAVKINDDDVENARRKQVVDEQEKSDLYQSIVMQLKPAHHYSNSLFKSDTEQKNEKQPPEKKDSFNPR